MARDLVEVLKALGSPTRLESMEWLRDPEESFADYEPIADRAQVGVRITHLVIKGGLAPSTTSGHMSMLGRAGLVASTRIGKWIHYRRNGPQIDDVIHRLAGALSPGAPATTGHAPAAR